MAAMLPTLLFLAVGIFLFLRAERGRVEAESLARSEVVMTIIDSSLRGDTAALSVLGSSIYLETREWPEFYPRLKRAASTNPHWATVVLYDVVAGEEILDIRRPLTAPRRTALIGGGDLAAIQRSEGPFVGTIQRSPEPMCFLFLPVRRDGVLMYVFAVGIKAQHYQDILLGQATSWALSGTTAAVVDQAGSFIARTVHYTQRVGTPATHYVRDSLRRKPSGFYRGLTYEGVKNYTAYYRSPWSGWSAHIAIASSLIDTPTSWSLVVASVAGVGCALLGGTLVILVLRDMSERRRSEEALRQSQKMEAVGQLTGGIAHDFNNLLTAIIGNLDLIRTRVLGQDRVHRLAENALEAARRGAKLASQLLAFSRTQRMQVQPVDLEKLLTGMSSLLAQSVGPAVALRIDISAQARVVSSDPNQLELAILNLAVNARDAMPQGGVLSIATKLATRSDTLQLQKGTYVQLIVSDTGAGMTEEVRSRAIEPFFTTKPLGQGTGLGLSQVYGIVSESGGAIDIVSAVNAGTTVRLILPLSKQIEVPQEPPVAISEDAKAEEFQGARILVVDDDPQVRRFLADSLRELGFSVVHVDSGQAALRELDQLNFELLVVDFAMPHMNGAEVARAAQEKQPRLRILIVSGYSDSAAIDAALGSAALLKKPFDVAELKEAVARTLSSPA